jgi:hypothetical protein
MSASSKNLGQIAGVHIGTTPPTNTLLIWYDNTPSQLIHKVYNPSTKLWGALDPEIVTNITYSELTTLAKNTGLTIGKYFQLTDVSNVLAIAITTTKVQYTDSKGNILIDDLGSNIQYHVSSSNLQIDDLSGVFDETNKKLVFQFDEYIPVISTDYLFGKVKRGTTWILAKFKFNSLLSTVTNNSLSWNGGLFFSFSAAIKNVLNKKGGVVGYDEYTTNNTKLNTSINNVGKNNENIIANADKALTDATTPSEIYAKAIPSAPVTGDAPGDVLKGDTLLLIINKFQRWVNKFKYATGISLSSAFADAKKQEYVNNNDTVESAFGKIQYMIKHPTTSGSLPGDWVDDHQSTDTWDYGSTPLAGDSLSLAFTKITSFLKHLTNIAKLSSNWEAKDYTETVDLPGAEDTLDEAFAKAVAKLNQLGTISNGRLTSKNTYEGAPTTLMDIGAGKHSLRGYSAQMWVDTHDGAIGLTDLNDSVKAFEVNPTGLLCNTGLTMNKSNVMIPGSTINYGDWLNVSVGALFKCKNSSSYFGTAAISATNPSSGTYDFDAVFNRLLIGRMIMNFASITESYSVTEKMFIMNNDSAIHDVYLPANPSAGTVIYITKQSNEGNINVIAQGSNGIDNIGSASSSVTITDRGRIYMFVFVPYVNYSTSTSLVGLWSYAKFGH